jgi:hypothetical protein
MTPARLFLLDQLTRVPYFSDLEMSYARQAHFGDFAVPLFPMIGSLVPSLSITDTDLQN